MVFQIMTPVQLGLAPHTASLAQIPRVWPQNEIPMCEMNGSLHAPLFLDGSLANIQVPANDAASLKQFFRQNARFFLNRNPSARIHGSPEAFHQAHDFPEVTALKAKVDKSLAYLHATLTPVQIAKLEERLCNTLEANWAEMAATLSASLYLGENSLSLLNDRCGPYVTPYTSASMALYTTTAQRAISEEMQVIRFLFSMSMLRAFLHYGMSDFLEVVDADGSRVELYDAWRDLGNSFTTRSCDHPNDLTYSVDHRLREKKRLTLQEDGSFDLSDIMKDGTEATLDGASLGQYLGQVRTRDTVFHGAIVMALYGIEQSDIQNILQLMPPPIYNVAVHPAVQPIFSYLVSRKKISHEEAAMVARFLAVPLQELL